MASTAWALLLPKVPRTAADQPCRHGTARLKIIREEHGTNFLRVA
jgi:hypothetical protein